jgi:dynein heavy chain, axonemal
VQADKTETKAKLADRLINGLSGENKRWSETVNVFDVKAGKLVGDVLIASSFVSYCGPFNMHFRQELVSEKWLKDLIVRKVPMTEGVVPLDQLTSDTEKAQWGNEGLPTDPLSIENGAIMMSSSRTTLMIDPQLQVCMINTIPPVVPMSGCCIRLCTCIGMCTYI